jgi:RimJ/RimL family protein N-acetyltransferase
MAIQREGPSLRTTRLQLRPWRPSDLAPFAALNADPDVRRYLGPLLTREESDAEAERIRQHFVAHGFGLWAVEVVREEPFVGFVGLAIPRFEAAFTPCVEVGWRLARAHWGRGYASEAAHEALAYGFDELALAEIVSFTTVGNQASRAVMERLGMHRDPADDFEHPLVAPGDPLRPHVLYRLMRTSWRPAA